MISTICSFVLARIISWERLKYFLFLHNCIILPCSHHNSTLLCLPLLSLSSYLSSRGTMRESWTKTTAIFCPLSVPVSFFQYCAVHRTLGNNTLIFFLTYLHIYSAALQGVCQTELKPF